MKRAMLVIILTMTLFTPDSKAVRIPTEAELKHLDEMAKVWDKIRPVYASGDFDKAIEMYKEVIAKYPNTEGSDLAKKQIKFIEDHSDYNREPLKLFAKAEYLRYNAMGGDIEISKKNELAQQAIELYQRIEKEYPQSSLVPLLKGYIISCYDLIMKRYDVVLPYYQEKAKADPSYHNQIARIYKGMKEYDNALESYNRYLKETPGLTPDDKQYIQSAIENIYRRQKKYDLYKEELLKRIKKDPTGSEAQYAHFQLVEIYLELKDYDNYIKGLKTLVIKFPGDIAANALGNLAAYYLGYIDPQKTPEPETAYKYLVKLMKEYPESNWAKNKESDYKELREKFGEKEYEYPEFTPMKEELSIGESVDEEKPLTKKKTGALNIKHILLIIIGALVLLGLFFVRSKVKKR